MMNQFNYFVIRGKEYILILVRGKAFIFHFEMYRVELWRKYRKNKIDKWEFLVNLG